MRVATQLSTTVPASETLFTQDQQLGTKPHSPVLSKWPTTGDHMHHLFRAPCVFLFVSHSNWTWLLKCGWALGMYTHQQITKLFTSRCTFSSFLMVNLLCHPLFALYENSTSFWLTHEIHTYEVQHDSFIHRSTQPTLHIQDLKLLLFLCSKNVQDPPSC